MQVRRSLFVAIIVACAALISVGRAHAQDTVAVQTLTYDSLARAGVFHFPDLEGQQFEKVLLEYRMRCHHALVSNGTKTEQGCGQWDYNCETYITDSSRVDSIKNLAPSSTISGFPSNTNFPYVSTPTTMYVRHDEKVVSFVAPPNFFPWVVGTGAARLSHPFPTTSRSGRTFYLVTAQELKAAGITGDTIRGISFNFAGGNNKLDGLRLRLSLTKATSVDEAMTRVPGLTEYYYLRQTLGSGTQNLYFYQPFVWDSVSNVLMEVTYTNNGPAAGDAMVIGGDVISPSTLTASTNESTVQFSGSEGIAIAPDNFDKLSQQITISAWVDGDSAVMPANSALFEGADEFHYRTINAHLPWSDGNVYWDCGGDGHGNYDRVSKATPKSNIAGRWNFWTFTKNAVTGRMSIYVNGSLLVTDTGKHRPIDLKALNLGTSVTSALTYFGKVCRFSIWTVELDSNHIKQIMQHDITSADPNYSALIAYYKLTEGHGSVVYDSSATHSSSQITGYPIWRQVRGEDVFTNFATLTTRPNIGFLQAVPPPLMNVADLHVFDTLVNPAHAVIDYALVRNDSIRTVDTTYKWAAGKIYTRDDLGRIVDSVDVPATDTVRISQLRYYQKWAQKFEIMSFVTPYGIGLDLGQLGKMWEFDVTDYLPILHGWKRLSMERGSGQEEFDLRFLFIKGTPPRNVLDIQQIWPMTEEPYQNILSDLRYEPRSVYLNPLAKGFKLRSMITGHGQEGEFIPRLHHVDVNSRRFEWQVYKICSTNPLYPQGGTWLYDRSGWCPGAPTLETEYELTNILHPGDSALFDYGVDMSGQAGGDSRYDPSNQLVTYGPPNFVLNAGIVEIERPSDRIAFGRINPACDLPVVVIRNNGSQQLTSLKFEYYVDGGPHRIYNWTGQLAFLDTLSVTLPVDSLGFWTSNATGQFHVDISSPNGGTDQYDNDNHYASTYKQPTAYQGPIVVNYRTNAKPTENYYEVRDLAGNTVFQILDTLSANTNYSDSLSLPVGCYSIIFHDDGEDGLSYWAEPSQGTGYLRLRQGTKSGKVVYQFQAEFGMYTQYDFEITKAAAGVENSTKGYQLVRIYPNPSHDVVNLQLEGYNSERFKIDLVDELGHVLLSEERMSSAAGRLYASFNLKGLAKGTYFLRMTSSSGSVEKPFVVE